MLQNEKKVKNEAFNFLHFILRSLRCLRVKWDIFWCIKAVKNHYYAEHDTLFMPLYLTKLYLTVHGHLFITYITYHIYSYKMNVEKKSGRSWRNLYMDFSFIHDSSHNLQKDHSPMITYTTCIFHRNKNWKNIVICRKC